jgi:hypothetical protein
VRETNSHLIGAQKCPRLPSFNYNSFLGYAPWRLCFGADVWPRLKTIDRVETNALATLTSSCWALSDLPAGFATFAADGDFATGVLAILAPPVLKTQASPRVR